MTRRLLSLLVAAIVLAPASANTSRAEDARFDLDRSDIRAFIDEVVSRNAVLDRDRVVGILANARPQPKIIELMTKPAERVVPWWEYRQRFLTEERIARGVDFWREHRATLERVAAEQGVDPQYIVAIVGVETFYGRVTGRFRVIDALATLAFDYPPRSSYFRSELEQFLLLAHEESVDPLSITGSYAGAMGAPQFMPSSYRRYAVDGSADSRRNLWEDWDDVIASVANYFRAHGWEPGQPVLAAARLDPDPSFQIKPGNLDLNETVGTLSAKGVQVDLDLPDSTPALLIAAEERDGPSYRVGFRNFHVITRYNRSTRYAMAVHDLAEAITERMKKMQN
ncbi:MAG: lytic murein transglycosylase B [Pseudomonadota bacterium]|jgi:lytic murein transglycosylase B|nr:MAG: lytic murein transglycosylase B [Pseudomonadota bacterium]